MTGAAGRRLLALAVLALCLGACTTLPPIRQFQDTPIAAAKPGVPGYRLDSFRTTTRDTLVVFAFSGGGIRSAAFGYGVLKAAHETNITVNGATVPLSDRIDVVTGVSGGAFTAAAFALHRDDAGFLAPDSGGHCTDLYCTGFLVTDFDAAILTGLFAPWYWIKPGWNMSVQMAAEYENVPFGKGGRTFGGKTFGDLVQDAASAGAKAPPFLVIQATDYGNQQPFTFTQNDFDLLCADLSTVHLSQALAASNGFPLLFAPVPVADFAGADKDEPSCKAVQPPTWANDATESDDLSRQTARTKIATQYRQSSDSILLLDGGIADNLALSGLMNITSESLGERPDDTYPAWPPASGGLQSSHDIACRLGLDHVARIVVVSADGESQPDNSASPIPIVGKLLNVANGVYNTGIDNNDFETLKATDAFASDLGKRLAELRCGAAGSPHAVSVTFAHLSFDDLDLDPEPSAGCSKGGEATGLRCRVSELAHGGTALTFAHQDIDDLVAAGRSAFQCNRRLHVFLAQVALAAPPSPVLACAKRP